MDAQKQFLSIAEAAKWLGIARITAYRWTESGYLPSVKLGSRRLVRIAELEAFIAQAMQSMQSVPAVKS